MGEEKTWNGVERNEKHKGKLEWYRKKGKKKERERKSGQGKGLGMHMN